MISENTYHKKIHYGFLGTLLWGSVIFALFVALQIGSVWLYIGATYGELKPNEVSVVMAAIENNGTVMAIGAILPAIFTLLLMAVIIKAKKNTRIQDYLTIRGFSFSDARFWLIILVVFLIASDGITYLMGKPIVPDVMLVTYRSAEPVWLLWLALIVAAPLFEEIFFRGFLLSGFSSSFMGPTAALIITSALWAVIHVQYEIYAIIIIFLMGILLGLAKTKSKSILLPIFLHATSNAIAAFQTSILI